MDELTPDQIKLILEESRQKQILAEEIFRNSIQKSLEEDETPPSSGKIINFIKFSNSNFGIFIYTSVLLSFVVWCFDSCKEKRTINQIRTETIKKLDAEIILRINTFTSLIIKKEKSRLDTNYIKKRIKPKPNYNYGYDRSYYKYLREDVKARGMNSNHKIHYYLYIYPEYKNKGLISLIAQLELLEQDYTKQQNLQKVLNFLSFDQQNLFEFDTKEQYCDQILNDIDAFQKNVIIDRWKNKWILYNNECSSSFCIGPLKDGAICRVGGK